MNLRSAMFGSSAVDCHQCAIILLCSILFIKFPARPFAENTQFCIVSKHPCYTRKYSFGISRREKTAVFIFGDKIRQGADLRRRNRNPRAKASWTTIGNPSKQSDGTINNLAFEICFIASSRDTFPRNETESDASLSRIERTSCSSHRPVADNLQTRPPLPHSLPCVYQYMYSFCRIQPPDKNQLFCRDLPMERVEGDVRENGV